MSNCILKLKRFWRRRSGEQQALLVLCLVLIIAAVIVIPISSTYNGHEAPSGDSSVCRTESCRRAGEMLRNSINLSVDPCEDFYMYGCGGWLKSNTIPNDTDSYGITAIIRRDVLSELKELLESTTLDAETRPVINKVVMFYNACKDEDAINKEGPIHVLGMLNDIGGWPPIAVGGSFQNDTYDWISALKTLQHRVAVGFLIRFVISANPWDTTQNIIQLERPSLFLDSKVVLHPKNYSEVLEKNRNFIRSYAVLLGAKEGDQLEEDIQSIVKFEEELVKISRAASKLPADYSNYTISKLMDLAPQTDWLRYIQEITNSSLLQVGENAVTGEEEILVEDLSYLQNLSLLLNQPNRTRQVASYIGWRALLVLRHLPANMAEAALNYSASLGFSTKLPERWTSCIALLNNVFQFATSYMYIQQHFTTDSKREVENLVADIQESFRQRLQENDWMDEETKKAAILKLEKMRVNIGYPDWITNISEVDNFYSKVPDMGPDAFNNDVAASEYIVSSVITTLRRKNEKVLWPMSSVEVNAGYSRNINGITFPAAFLQWPFFAPSLPRYYNYGAIGAIIGHEITHGFDNQGRRRDADGNAFNWWSNASATEFKTRSQCFVDQYDKYGMRGEATLAENIADSGGLQQTYLAFHRWMQNKTDVKKLPFFEDFTAEQLFFITYSSIWCTRYRPAALQYVIKNQVHCPGQYRVWGSVSNLPEFSAAFGCKTNSSMNPASKCVIW